MVRSVLDGDEPPLLGLMADAESSLTGLRLVRGDEILKIECGVQAVRRRRPATACARGCCLTSAPMGQQIVSNRLRGDEGCVGLGSLAVEESLRS